MNWNIFIRTRLPVLFLCAALLCAGIAKKEGYHMDELLSFELANAEFNPWIVPTQPEGRLAKFVHNEIDGETLGETLANLRETLLDVLKNGRGSRLLSYTADVYEEPVWIAGQTFEKYITVDRDDAFNYLSVYFNVKDDNHPPLHFMLLHTLSSLFPGSVSPFVGCVINLAAVLGILLLLMRTGERFGAVFLERGTSASGVSGRLLGVMAALAYGLSAGAMATTLLVRMYALVTFFCVALFALHVRKWTEDGFAGGNRLLILVTVLGFWTQYFFLFYCLVLALVTAALLAARRKYRELFGYARSLAFAACIGVVGFPFAISDVFQSSRGVEALRNLAGGPAEYAARLGAFWGVVADRTVSGAGLVLAAALLIVCLAVSVRRRQGRALLLMLILPAAGYFLLAAKMSPYLVDRYMMPVFPFVLFGLVFGLLWLLGFLGVPRLSCTIVCGVLVVWQIGRLGAYDGEYLYTGYLDQRAVAEAYAEESCICVYAGVGYYENLLEFAEYERTLLLTRDELLNREDKESIRALDEAVVILKTGVDQDDVIEALEEEYGLVLEEWLIESGVHGDWVGLFIREGKGENL